MTKQKELIVKILKAYGHLTAENVYKFAKLTMPNIALGTVYRNLNLMLENNEISKISISNGPDVFDITTKKHNHLVCVKCGKVIDVFENIVNLKKIKCENANILDYNLSINCICEDCAKKENKFCND